MQWEGLPLLAATWEDVRSMQKFYPTFNLKDKVVFKGEGNVTGQERVRNRQVQTT